MSATEREVPFEVAREGGLPTEAELTDVWEALSNVEEFGLDRLVRRIAEPLVEAFESEGDVAVDVDWTYEEAGKLAAHVDMLVQQTGALHETAQKLQQLRVAVTEVVWNGGRVHHEPPFDKYGQGYEPSREALERWGLAKPKADDAR